MWNTQVQKCATKPAGLMFSMVDFHITIAFHCQTAMCAVGKETSFVLVLLEMKALNLAITHLIRISL